jgi:hypothetical protein
MDTSTVFSALDQVTRPVRDSARHHVSEQLVRLSGRAADWLDTAGCEVAELSERGADRLGELGYSLADVLSREADRLGGQLSRQVLTWFEQCGDRVVRLGEDLS